MKQFDKWNEVKKRTDKIERRLRISPRDIYWMKIGQNIGHEEFGKGKEFVRPVIVIRQLTNDLFIGVPTTTSKKEDNDYFHNINYFNHKKEEEIHSVAMLLQFKTSSKKRLLTKIGTVDKNVFDVIVEKLKGVIDPTHKPSL
jgi:mRNA interferase MazF